MKPIIFYADLKSQPCRAVYLFMKAANIPFTLEKVDLMMGEQLQEKFTKISPIQRVPVIDDNGFILGESGAIFRYLARKFQVPDHWYPSRDLQQQARIDEYLHWHHTNIRVNAMMTFRHQFINTMRGRLIKEDEVKKFKADLIKAMNHIDKYFLKDNPFIAGKDVSVADFQALCELMQLDIIGNENLYLSNPKLKAWADRVKAVFQPYFSECLTEGIQPMADGFKQMTSSKL